MTPEKYGLVMSGTSSAMVRVRPDPSAWAVGFGYVAELAGHAEHVLPRAVVDPLRS